MNMKLVSYCSRRHFLRANAFGLGSLALTWLLDQERLLAAPVKPHIGQQFSDALHIVGLGIDLGAAIDFARPHAHVDRGPPTPRAGAVR